MKINDYLGNAELTPCGVDAFSRDRGAHVRPLMWRSAPTFIGASSAAWQPFST